MLFVIGRLSCQGGLRATTTERRGVVTDVRAARLHEHGAPLVVEDITLPDRPPAGEVRVELVYAGVNPIDRYIAAGRVAPDSPLPRTLGGEASGRLDGQSVLVAGTGLGASRDGVFATVADVPEGAVVELPEGVAERDAAAMGVAGLTAWNCVHELARVEPEDRVLLLGASGGVGSVILSLVAAAGATAWGQTGSEDKCGHITDAGASRAVVADPLTLEQAVAELQPTVVFDSLGNGFLDPCVSALCPRGRIVTFGTSAGGEATFNVQNLYRKAITHYGYGGLQLTQEERRTGLAHALEALARGDLRIPIDAVLPLGEVNEAFERLEQRGVRGKLLLGLRDD
jgi:NADPH2:quinone reductase